MAAGPSCKESGKEGRQGWVLQSCIHAQRPLQGLLSAPPLHTGFCPQQPVPQLSRRCHSPCRAPAWHLSGHFPDKAPRKQTSSLMNHWWREAGPGEGCSFSLPKGKMKRKLWRAKDFVSHLKHFESWRTFSQEKLASRCLASECLCLLL